MGRLPSVYSIFSSLLCLLTLLVEETILDNVMSFHVLFICARSLNICFLCSSPSGKGMHYNLSMMPYWIFWKYFQVFKSTSITLLSYLPRQLYCSWQLRVFYGCWVLFRTGGREPSSSGNSLGESKIISYISNYSGNLWAVKLALSTIVDHGRFIKTTGQEHEEIK